MLPSRISQPLPLPNRYHPLELRTRLHFPNLILGAIHYSSLLINIAKYSGQGISLAALAEKLSLREAQAVLVSLVLTQNRLSKGGSGGDEKEVALECSTALRVLHLWVKALRQKWKTSPLFSAFSEAVLRHH